MSRRNLQRAIDDIRDGVAAIHVWPALGWQEVVQRYRRSVLGPFWLTVSTGIMVGVMGPLYGNLFRLDIATYFPYLAVSIVVWQSISQLVQDASTVFVASEGYIKQIRLPYTVYVLRLIWKNLIIFGHNLLVVLAVVAYFRPPIGNEVLLFPLGILLLATNALWAGAVLGLICARFRDIPLLVTNLMQVAFFLTPIIWQPGMLGRYAWTVNLNPFYHFLEIIRAPLTGAPVTLFSWIAVAFITLVGYGVMIVMFSKYRARIAYWV